MRPFVIVTVRDSVKNYDIEVPTNLPVKYLAADIMEVLSSYNPKEISAKPSCTLYCERLDRVLRENETFGSAGIWSGDVIIIE